MELHKCIDCAYWQPALAYFGEPTGQGGCQFTVAKNRKGDKLRKCHKYRERQETNPGKSSTVVANLSIYSDAIDIWGEEAQLDMAIEECAELIKAICKRKRGDAWAELKVLEEAADVAITIEQLICMYGKGEYNRLYNEKLEKLRQHILNTKETRKNVVR